MAAHITTPVAKRIPSFLYGTAWKKRRTRELVQQALQTGFTGIDTACQPKHYEEDLVGAGIRDAISTGRVCRENLWIQTKFTSIHGQDPNRLPYNAEASIQDQVKASVAQSLHNLRSSPTQDQNIEVGFLDGLLLHSPYPDPDQTLVAWEELSKHVPHSIGVLGISNISFSDLEHLYSHAQVKPAIVQNPFHAGAGYDARIRAFCREKGIVYQSFWTLTANPHLLNGEVVKKLASEADVSVEVALYALVALGLDVRVLNGTTNEGRMCEDLAGLEKVRHYRQSDRGEWQKAVSLFKGLLSRGRIL